MSRFEIQKYIIFNYCPGFSVSMLYNIIIKVCEYRSAKQFCASSNMTLWSPDLQTMIKNMTNLNATTFWTGFERVNDTFFFEEASLAHANCQSNSWQSGVNQERDSIPELNSGDSILTNLDKTLVRRTSYKKIILFPISDFCHDWQWDGKLKAVLKNDRFFGYQVTGLSGLETTDCLCYKYRPSLFDIVSNHRKIMGYSLFGVLRKVFGYTSGYYKI